MSSPYILLSYWVIVGLTLCVLLLRDSRKDVRGARAIIKESPVLMPVMALAFGGIIVPLCLVILLIQVAGVIVKRLGGHQ